MKFILTESKIEQIIFKYLDNQDFIVGLRENPSRFCFYNSINDDKVQISCYVNGTYCTLKPSLIEEISDFFSLEESVSKNIIAKWVENKLKITIEEVV